MMLRTRTALVVIAAAVFAILSTASLGYRNVAQFTEQQVGLGLNNRADSVIALVDAGKPIPQRPDMIEQRLLPDGSVMSLSPGRPPIPVGEDDRRVARTGQGIHDPIEDVVIGGEPYGVFTKAIPGGRGAVMIAQNFNPFAQGEHDFLVHLAVSTLVSVGVAALLSWLVLGRILRPVRRLVAVTDRISSTGELDTPLPPAGRDEVGSLTQSFGSMLAALRLSRAQQHRLVQDASHELRTPLTAVRASAELLQRARGKLEPADEEQLLTVLVRESQALDDLVRELVELATDQYSDEEPAMVELAELAGERAERYASARSVSVLTDDPALVRVRVRALQRVLDNLLSNAIKFSPPGTPIEIRIHGGRLTVRDHGPGIGEADQTSIFDRFYRAEATQDTPGSGLGLAIVQDIITTEGGTVFAGNHPEGGAEIGFRLPVH
ncbi:sensor histidine kinase [Pseudonocardiaceae bacterium YIM PH 21723]|nr:sensor histidine kinase [Pseudonocardiaceae bacterium YIM PH 21723]